MYRVGVAFFCYKLQIEFSAFPAVIHPPIKCGELKTLYKWLEKVYN